MALARQTAGAWSTKDAVEGGIESPGSVLPVPRCSMLLSLISHTTECACVACTAGAGVQHGATDRDPQCTSSEAAPGDTLPGEGGVGGGTSESAQTWPQQAQCSTGQPSAEPITLQVCEWINKKVESKEESK